MTEDTDMTAADIAGQVLNNLPNGTKDEWGRLYLELAKFQDVPEVHAFVHSRTVSALGAYVAGIKSATEKQHQRQRLMDRGVAVATGRPITPTLSVRNLDGTSQAGLWYEATPSQFVEAVLREQRVIDGRDSSNAIRLRVVTMIQADERLMELPTLADVCAELRIDPDGLGLDELDVG